TLDRKVVDVREVLGHTLSICQGDLHDKHIRLELDLSAPAHHVLADPARLQQVFWNLIKNAAKFTPDGGLLAIRTRNSPAAGPDDRDRPTLSVEFTDSGVGIDAELLPRIFDVFEQGEGATNRRMGGLGLGLAISRSVAEAHGGNLTALSRGKGTGAT